jgi:hypothetical protein
VYIEIVPNCRIYYVIKDEVLADEFARGQTVVVSGEIQAVSALLDRVTLHMVDESVQIEP